MYIFVKGYKNKNHWQQKLLWFVASQYFGMSPVCIYCCLDIWKIYIYFFLFFFSKIVREQFFSCIMVRTIFSVVSWWEQFFCCIMVRKFFQLYHGENNFSVVSWWEQFFQLYHGENNFFSCIMVRTTFQLYHGENNFSVVSWWEQFFSCIMVRTICISMRWWRCPLCTRSTCLVGFIILLAHRDNNPQVASLGHNILIPSQLVFVLST